MSSLPQPPVEDSLSSRRTPQKTAVYGDKNVLRRQGEDKLSSKGCEDNISAFVFALFMCEKWGFVRCLSTMLTKVICYFIAPG